ncbi:glycoside hydrolase family 9 protein [Actinomadura sp. DC4]|uniref:glycoside hydrolase family 9 protein n=1 Tax=Actinomadura sp. DC4 TaxID=3055069 RepID=UPI0025B25959|nr:glycoside hydrolase family 9 protein [Actinomadura sp. DC4]MDN3355073.1 glycoside hydrolase family 9 protein [Actinomadura sp. DC4]
MRLAAAAVILLISTAGAACGDGRDAASQSTAKIAGFIRVDQVGYAATETKQAYLMTTAPAAGARFTVTDARSGRTVLEKTAGPRLGSWNSAYPDVYALDLTRLRRPGTYRVRAAGDVSPPFRVGGTAMFRRPADDAAAFFGTQRDGADVIPGEPRRRPSHLNDRTAKVYARPAFTGSDTDEIAGSLTKIGGPVDVEGGWFDAGDFLKFTHTAAFADTLLWAARRDGGPDPRVEAEARHGRDWLTKMWDGKTLYLQVGIGSGNAKGTFVGDHDTWRLPERDDADRAKGHEYLRSRPVFRANAPGKPISPNLAGRVSAAFALAAQVEDPRRARTDLATAARIYAMAKTTHVGRLDTGLPHAFYPEDAWHDDMELGGAELALAARRLGDPRAATWLDQAAKWAGQYIAHDSGKDTFNLYDVSALAHADLVRAGRGRLNTGKLIADLRAQLNAGANKAAADPFHAGAVYTDFDSVPHAFGLVATARLYGAVSGDRRYDAFATAQRGWVLGANAWGTSFMVGEGTEFERCPQHVVANLSGLANGAVVNGPNGTPVFEDGLDDYLDGMNHCPPDGVDANARFTGHGSRYVDDVRSWQTSEPADDFTALGLYALTLTAAGGGR